MSLLSFCLPVCLFSVLSLFLSLFLSFCYTVSLSLCLSRSSLNSWYILDFQPNPLLPLTPPRASLTIQTGKTGGRTIGCVGPLAKSTRTTSSTRSIRIWSRKAKYRSRSTRISIRTTIRYRMSGAMRLFS